MSHTRIPPIVAKQRFGKMYPSCLLDNDSVNTFPWQRIRAAIEELLEAYVCGSVYPPVIAG
jgi:hypothetical protein